MAFLDGVYGDCVAGVPRWCEALVVDGVGAPKVQRLRPDLGLEGAMGRALRRSPPSRRHAGAGVCGWMGGEGSNLERSSDRASLRTSAPPPGRPPDPPISAKFDQSGPRFKCRRQSIGQFQHPMSARCVARDRQTSTEYQNNLGQHWPGIRRYLGSPLTQHIVYRSPEDRSKARASLWCVLKGGLPLRDVSRRSAGERHRMT